MYLLSTNVFLFEFANQNSLVTENDVGFVPSSSGLQLGQSSSMSKSQPNPLSIESETISIKEIMQLLTDDDVNSKSEYNDNEVDEQDGKGDEHTNKKMRNRRHTKQQIEEMEALFKECPKPDKKKIKELSDKIELEPLQIVFWFQNRRTQLKNQNQHSENLSLRDEYDKLRTEYAWLSEVVNNGCPNCSDHGFHLGETPDNDQYLRLKNARQEEEVVHISRQHIAEVIRAAMYELLQMAQMGEPLWLPNNDLNIEEYKRKFPRRNEPKPNGIKTCASRESSLVTMNHINLVKIFMDTIYAEFQVPSPQIPNRDCYFVRSCNKIVDGLWVIVDVSLDNTPITRCWKRPSGCVIQQISNDISKVTWIEHIEAHDTLIHTFYKAFVNSSLAFGAKRWISILDRQCERLASVEATNLPQNNITHTQRRKSVLKLGERMIINYISGVSGTKTHKWTTFTESGYNINDLQVMTRQSINDPGRPRGLVLCASTSIWLPVLPKLLFDFLRNENTRGKWDILTNGGTIQEVTHIANGMEIGNSISISRVNCPNQAQNGMLIIQESITDPTGSFIVYAPIDIRAIDIILCGGNPDVVPLLPSGFAIFPDGPSGSTNHEISDYSGSFLTIAFQILVDTVPTTNISPQSVAAVDKLMFCTIYKIKNALFLNF
ncbi:homeobox-leucine zipper protein ROC7-like [Solanum pennellii]|uniref:Homeobox-leucine zipper protein ROC7-like n=1 Tax=Solanum pennellii TaxID=28526 RepID=A0ABM1H7G1_SOLPN|nr:homeobox-leucine zipper protein ROC7-like [Solanum pennellii]